MMPSAGPRSQCACGSKSKTRGSPTRRTSRLSAALAPTGTCARRQVRDGQQQRAPLVLDRVEVRLELLDRLAALAVGGEHGARVAPFLLRARDLLARRVLLALERLDLDNHRAPARVERRERLEVGVGVDAAVPEAGPHDVRVVADERWIDHGKPILAIRHGELGFERLATLMARTAYKERCP